MKGNVVEILSDEESTDAPKTVTNPTTPGKAQSTMKTAALKPETPARKDQKASEPVQKAALKTKATPPGKAVSKHSTLESNRSEEEDDDSNIAIAHKATKSASDKSEKPSSAAKLTNDRTTQTDSVLILEQTPELLAKLFIMGIIKDGKEHAQKFVAAFEYGDVASSVASQEVIKEEKKRKIAVDLKESGVVARKIDAVAELESNPQPEPKHRVDVENKFESTSKKPKITESASSLTKKSTEPEDERKQLPEKISDRRATSEPEEEEKKNNASDIEEEVEEKVEDVESANQEKAEQDVEDENDEFDEGEMPEEARVMCTGPFDDPFKRDWDSYKQVMTNEISAARKIAEVIEAKPMIQICQRVSDHDSKHHSLLSFKAWSSGQSASVKSNPRLCYYIQLPKDYMSQFYKMMNREGAMPDKSPEYAKICKNAAVGNLVEVDLASNLDECEYYIPLFLKDLDDFAQKYGPKKYQKIIGIEVCNKSAPANSNRIFGVSNQLFQLLLNASIYKVGLDLKATAARLLKNYRLKVVNGFDLYTLGRNNIGPLCPKEINLLSILSSKFLLDSSEKVLQSHWDIYPLNDPQLKYASASSFALLECFYALYNRHKVSAADATETTNIEAWAKKYHPDSAESSTKKQ